MSSAILSHCLMDSAILCGANSWLSRTKQIKTVSCRRWWPGLTAVGRGFRVCGRVSGCQWRPIGPDIPEHAFPRGCSPHSSAAGLSGMGSGKCENVLVARVSVGLADRVIATTFIVCQKPPTITLCWGSTFCKMRGYV
jgi:hypothetical protein